jgi:hypothetical protein
LSGTTPDSVSYPVQNYGILGPLPAYVINIQDIPGADPTGNDDSTGAIQFALDSLPDGGGELVIAPGVYKFSAPLVLKANTVITGTGTLKAAPIAEWPGSSRVPPFTAMPGSPFFGLVNENHDAAVITDENLTVRGITIDYTALPAADGTRHCIYFRKARRVVIEGVTILGGSSSIALLGCDDTQEIGNRLVGFSNCGSDHWDGPSNCRVIGCHLETDESAQMVNWNPDPTLGSSVGYEATGFVMTGCTLVSRENPATPSQIEPLRIGGVVRNVAVTCNTFVNCSLVLRADTAGAIVEGNTFSGFVGTGEAITAYDRFGVDPGAITVSNNIIRDPLTSAGNVGVIRIESALAQIFNNVIMGVAYGAAPIYTGNPTVGQIFGNYTEAIGPISRLQSGIILQGGSTKYYGWTDGAGTHPRMYQQTSDNNWIFQTTNSAGGPRVALSIYARSDTSDLIASVPMLFTASYRHAVATVAAAGTVIGTATALTANTSNVTTCTAGVNDGVRLAPVNGRPQTVINSTADVLKVYPNNSGTSQIDNGGASVPATIAAGKSKTFEQVASGDFRTTAAT